MAAAIVPLEIGTALLPLIKKLSVPLIQLAQAHLPKDSRMSAVLSALQSLMQPLATAGTIQQAVPTAAQLQPVVEGILAGLKLIPGALPAEGTGASIPPGAPSGQVVVVGTVITGDALYSLLTGGGK